MKHPRSKSERGKRKPIKKKSDKQKLIDENLRLIREILFIERGRYCQICGRTKGLGLFHILSQGAHPKLRFCEKNILIACWKPCHYTWHHDSYKAKRMGINAKIEALAGSDYHDQLMVAEKFQEKHTIVYLNNLRFFLKSKLEALKRMA